MMLPAEQPPDLSAVFASVLDTDHYSVVFAHGGFNAVICDVSDLSQCAAGELVRTIDGPSGTNVSIGIIDVDKADHTLTLDQVDTFWRTVDFIEGVPAWAPPQST